MKKILLIISCMVIVFLNQGAAQETEKWNDKQIEELSKKFFHYSTVDGKESLVLTNQPDDKWYEKAFADSCDNTIVNLRRPETAISIPGSPLILALLQCPASRDFQYDSVVTFFERKGLEAPLCFYRLALMPESGSYY